jgi:hypothetical protein
MDLGKRVRLAERRLKVGNSEGRKGPEANIQVP